MSPGCNCCGPSACKLCVPVTGCSNQALPGATVTVNTYPAGTLVGTAITDATGKGCVSLPATGSYTYTVSCTNFTSSGPTQVSVTCPAGLTTSTVNLIAAFPAVCCGCSQVLPRTLHLNDGLTTFPINRGSGPLAAATYKTFTVSGIALPCAVGKAHTSITATVAYDWVCAAGHVQVNVYANVCGVGNGQYLNNDTSWLSTIEMNGASGLLSGDCSALNLTIPMTWSTGSVDYGQSQLYTNGSNFIVTF